MNYETNEVVPDIVTGCIWTAGFYVKTVEQSFFNKKRRILLTPQGNDKFPFSALEIFNNWSVRIGR